MAQYSIDITYACAQLGVVPGTSLDEIKAVLDNAVAHKFFTKSRVARVERLVAFFIAWTRFGGFGDSFADIKKAYHRQAMALHPDRNKGDNASEERLKEINAAYGLIDQINREAKAYYRQNETIRRDLEDSARQETERENPQQEPMQKKPSARPRSVGAKKYMAASIPRSIRTARLGYLPVQTVIGCKMTRKQNDVSMIFDVIMLPAEQFVRARSYLSAPDVINAHLQYGKFAPTYTPRDVKEITVPAGEADPEQFARDYFVKAFGL